ncbi:MAG: hypothetical protein K2H76_09795, partial [Muribaculaceae bacterium]|nr:hypothetical protein [Muribaculaceae bacterium]
MKKIVIGVSCILGIVAMGCSNGKRKGDPNIERNFQGDWSCDYLIDNSDMRMRVLEKISFDTLDHRYKVEQVLKVIYPVTITYSTVSYEGTWSADQEYMKGIIDQSTLVNELNPQFEQDEEYKVYKDMVKNSADADMATDGFKIRLIKP